MCFIGQKLRAVHGSHDQVMSEMERVKQQLMEEQNRRMAVESELRMGTTSQRTIVEVWSFTGSLKLCHSFSYL